MGDSTGWFADKKGHSMAPLGGGSSLQGVKTRTSLSRTCGGGGAHTIPTTFYNENLKPCTCITFVSLSQRESKARLIQLSGSWPALSSKVVQNLIE